MHVRGMASALLPQFLAFHFINALPTRVTTLNCKHICIFKQTISAPMIWSRCVSSYCIQSYLISMASPLIWSSNLWRRSMNSAKGVWATKLLFLMRRWLKTSIIYYVDLSFLVACLTRFESRNLSVTSLAELNITLIKVAHLKKTCASIILTFVEDDMDPRTKTMAKDVVSSLDIYLFIPQDLQHTQAWNPWHEGSAIHNDRVL